MGFLADIRQLMKNAHKQARSSLNLPSKEKTNVCPEKMLIKKTDGAQNTVKTMKEKNVCLRMYE